MKIFKVGFKSSVCYSVNMIWANTGKEEREAVEETASRRAERYGYEVAFVNEITEAEANGNLAKGMPYYGIDEQAERDHDPSFAEEVTEATKEEGGETEAAPAYTITTNTQYSSVEVSFNGKPAEEVRNALKALRFRWHGQKRVWYGYATEEAVRAAIEGKQPEAAQSTEKPVKAAKKATKGTEQNHVRIYWNGIKIDGGKLIRCGYSLDNNTDHEPSVSIYACHYDNLPRDLFEVKNDSDLYTDYFESDRAYLTPAHPLYKYFRYAAEKAQARQDRPYCERLRETLNSGKREPWPGHYDCLREDLARREAFLAQFDKTADPGQPTAEDLAEIDRQKQEAENARRAAEHEEELREREAYLSQRVNGQRLIEAERTAHPVEDGKPAVCINWSEHPAFCDFEDDALLLSVTAAENILRQLDEDQHNTRETSYGRGWYYKTKFTITGTDDSGEAFTYTGRYDLGDGDGGLVEHIRAFGRYFLTHDEHGHTKHQPDETNDTIRFADFLAGFVA